MKKNVEFQNNKINYSYNNEKLKFKTSGKINFRLILNFSEINVLANDIAIALPAISFFISSIEELGFKSRPPVSKVMPFPIIIIVGNLEDVLYLQLISISLG